MSVPGRGGSPHTARANEGCSQVRAYPQRRRTSHGGGSRSFRWFGCRQGRHAVAIAEDGRRGEVRFLGEIDGDPTSLRRLVSRLERRYARLHFCCEAGPTGYGWHRQLTAMGHRCTVVAPSLIPRKPGDRLKTNRRDALQLARLLRAGELTVVWVSDEPHEAVRELIRSREAAVDDLRRKRQAISSMMLRYGRSYPGRKTWGARHRKWLQAQRFDHPAQQLVLQEMTLAAQYAQERRKRVEAISDSSEIRGNRLTTAMDAILVHR